VRKIMVINPKGGSGKSTLATNLASHYAVAGRRVGLADFDRQGSSREWLAVRPETLPTIGLVPVDEGKVLVPWNLDVLVMDAPAGVNGKDLKKHVKRAQTVLIPVLPSPFDIRATAHFIEELLLVGRISRQETRIAVVANRVREQTRVYQALHRFLESLEIPFVAVLRDSQNYIRAAEQGRGIFELPASRCATDREQWAPLLRWLESRASRPAKKRAAQKK